MTTQLQLINIIIIFLFLPVRLYGPLSGRGIPGTSSYNFVSLFLPPHSSVSVAKLRYLSKQHPTIYI